MAPTRLPVWRRAMEIGLYVLLGALAAGVAFVASGLARQPQIAPDDLMWLGNNNGQATGVDPHTGQPVERVQIGGPGDEMTVTQGDGVLIVTNSRTAEVTVVALPTLEARQVRADLSSIEVLLAEGRIIVVDKAAGLVERIHPVTADRVGTPWLTDVALVDTVSDATGLVWVLGEGGQLVALRWSDRAGGFLEERRSTVDGAGPLAVLVAHELGVTVLAPDTGGIVQVGTGHDRTARTTYLRAPLVAADLSPAELVPVAMPATSTVLLIRRGDVVAVDGSLVGCATPGRPVVYQGIVYAPCLGAGKVVVIEPTGRVGGEIATPAGGEPVLILVTGRLVINVPGANAGLIVGPDGSARAIQTSGPTVRSRGTQTRPATAPGASPRNRRTTAAAPQGPRTSPAGPVAGAPTSAAQPPPPPPPPPPLPVPTGVSAVELANGNVRITWTSGGPTSSYRILHAGSGAVLASPAGTAVSAVVNGQPYLGQPTQLIVEAMTASGSYRSAPSNTVYPYVEPREPPPCRGCQIP